MKSIWWRMEHYSLSLRKVQNVINSSFMKEQPKDKARVLHIKEACQLLIKQQEGDSLESIQSNPIKFYGYVKLVEIIGEATYKMSKEYKEANAFIP